MKLGILTDLYQQHKFYEKSCQTLNIDFVTIDICTASWLENLQNNLDCNGFLVRPMYDYEIQRDVYMERLYTIAKQFNKPLYPSYEELMLYENKRTMANWLIVNKFPHVKTHVFINKQEAKEFFLHCRYPVVIKSNLGAGALGVEIVKTRHRANKIVNRIFGRISSLFVLGHPQKRKKWGIDIPVYGTAEKHVLLVQEFKKIKWEWRIIKIGNSFFGHQKLLNKQFASGSGLVGWVAPPGELLNLVKAVCETGHFNSMAVDIFETENNHFYINELQSVFGSYLDYQMRVNDIPGRYLFKNDEFVFEKGEFNQFASCMLRVEHFIELLLENIF
jgi:glutathione synthase/RimK-type ligase-like ATP-grasp enzyme